MSDTKARFDAAVAKSKTLPAQPPANLLDLYALFKQASEGDVKGSRPGMLDIRGRAKWDAWEKRKGQSAEVAQEAYIALVEKLAGA